MGNWFYLDKTSQGLLDFRLRTWEFVSGDLRMRGGAEGLRRTRRDCARGLIHLYAGAAPGGQADGVTAADVFYSRWQTAGQVVKVRGRQSPNSDWLITWSCKHRVSPGQNNSVEWPPPSCSDCLIWWSLNCFIVHCRSY